MSRGSKSRAASTGPVLLRGPLGLAIRDALLADNEGAAVVDRGGYLRVSAPAPCRLRRATVERIAGRSFSLPNDLELVMVSFHGRLSFDDDEVTWNAP